MNINETQVAYREMGLVLTPLKGKDAFLRKWQKREYANGEWKQWMNPATPHNIGLVLGDRSHNIVCIDIDPRNGGKEWADKNQHIIDACQIVEESGRGDGGLHLFFTDTGGQFARKCCLDKGVDFLTTGSQVVLAPSIHPDTDKPYTKTKGDLSMFAFSITELPDEIKAFLTQYKIDQKRESQEPVETGRDIPEKERRILVDKLATINPSMQGRHGTIGSWITDAVGGGMEREEIKSHAEMWMLSQGRDLQPMEVENWIKNAEEKLPTGESYISDNRIAPERFIAKDVDDVTGFQAVETEIPENRKHKAFELELHHTKKGEVMNTLYNIQMILENHVDFMGKLAYNEVTCSPIKYLSQGVSENMPWDSPAARYNDRSTFGAHDFSALHHWFSKTAPYNLEVSDGNMKKAVSNIARLNVVHPVRDWLLDLKWDGEERLSQWLPRVTGAESTEYHKQIGKYMIYAMVARIIEPGTKWDNCFILEGPQGNGKSTLCELLAGKPENYCDTPGDLKDNKTTVELTLGATVVELAEVDQYLRSYSSSKLKHWLSVGSDTVRLAYAPEAIKVPRSFIVIGTTNETEYLQDSTGERRYLPVKTGPDWFDIEWLKENRDQIFAEALKGIQNDGIPTCLRVPRSFIALQNAESAARKEIDAWDDIVKDYLAKEKKQFYFISDILYNALMMEPVRQTTKEKGRIKKIMHSLGYVHSRPRVEGIQRSVYRVGANTPCNFRPEYEG